MLTASGTMFHIDGLESFYLKPGCLFVTMEPTAISTVLGSCIAVCFFSSDFRCGGMNHYVFPEWKSGKKRTTNFGDLNLRECLKSFAEFGYAPQELFARIIGGAWIKDNDSSKIISEENARVAEQFCKDMGVRVISKETGGNSGRRVLFRTDSGEASVERIVEVDPEIYRYAEDGGNG